MKTQDLKSSRWLKIANRRGNSLMEVVVCLGLMAVLAAPVAGLMQASWATWNETDSRYGRSAAALSTARWLQQRIETADSIVRVTATSVQLNERGVVATIRLNGSNVELVAGGRTTVVAQGIRDLRLTSVSGGRPARAMGVQIDVTPTVQAGGPPATAVSTLATIDFLRF
jgi:hypothetical protein